MKKLFPLFFCFFAIGMISAQTCVTLQPGASGIDAVIGAVVPNTPGPTHTDFSSEQWTYGGINKESVGLLKFDLSFIPTGSTINSAYLSLYANTNSSNGINGSPMHGNNASNLERVTSTWDENTVTWNTRPTTTTVNQILLPTSTSPTQDYPNINITGFAQFWAQNPSQNYGMELDMITTSALTSMIFASSDQSDPTKAPKLVICYSPPCATPTITIGLTQTQTTVGNNGAVNLTVTGSGAPYTYSWTGPSGFTASTEDISSLAIGTYNVTVTPLAGCSATGSITVTRAASVPTLSQWGLILLTLLTLTMVLAFMLYGQGALSVAGVGGSFAPLAFVRSMPFNKQLFGKILMTILPVAMLGFLAVHYFIGTNGALDFTGTMISTVIFGYMIQFVVAKK